MKDELIFITIVKQILLVSTLDNVWRTVQRICILMLECKGLKVLFIIFPNIHFVSSVYQNNSISAPRYGNLSPLFPIVTGKVTTLSVHQGMVTYRQYFLL